MADIQAAVTTQLTRFSQGAWRPDTIGFDYYIALPCMHFVQPLIVLWFLRDRGRIFWLVLIYDVGLIASVLLLEQHYVVDLLAAPPVAFLALAAVDWDGLMKSLRIPWFVRNTVSN
jgi:hypothetical protein